MNAGTAAQGPHKAAGATPLRQIRAVYDERTITVYQAYSPAIAGPAVAAGRFVPPFNVDRMTWIKPSFLWMMYRSGWATKPGQECILAIRLRHEGFVSLLGRSCLSHFDPTVHPSHDAWKAQLERSPVRIQWDPERTLDMRPLPWRSIQIGLSGDTVHDYVNRWTIDITDITPKVREMERTRHLGAVTLPHERPYPLHPEIGSVINASGPLSEAGSAGRSH